MSVTIKDVARIAGVAPSTVSRVIAGSPRISGATAEKIRAIMEELGYHPNALAKGLVSNTTCTLAVFLQRPAEEMFANLFFSEFFRGTVTRAVRSEYDIMLTTGMSEADELSSLNRLVRGRRVDGVILLTSRPHDPAIRLMKKLQFPFILVGRSDEFPETLSVDIDNVQAAYDATRHLIELGHERIGFVSGPSHLIVSRDRLEGYEKALREAGLVRNPEWVMESDFLQESGYRAMSVIMSLEDRPTSLVSIDDMVTFGILRGLGELGYSVPQDLSIVSFNNTSLSSLSSPPLTSVDVGAYQLGYQAAQALIQSVQNEYKGKPRVIVPHRLIVRGSSKPVRAVP